MRVLSFLILLPTVASSFVLRAPLSTTTPSSLIRRKNTRLASSTTEPPEAATPIGSGASKSIRPLHQNWWPATLEESLDPSKPNAIQILGIKLVLFKSEGDWACLHDRCSHRFAPLSEGRVVVTKERTGRTCLQCAYHGWEFNTYGRCQRVPQTGLAAGAKPVPAYPLKVAAGMVWIFMDPNSPGIAGEVKLPVTPLLDRWHKAHGDWACFMRDLPFGYELLGENLMDLSQLIYSHPAFGIINRENGVCGQPIPFTMLTAKEKSADGPIYEAAVQNAKSSDPFFRNMGDAVPENASARVGFYEASHVRYTRRAGDSPITNVEFFLCPLSPGKSRVFMYSVSEEALVQKEEELATGRKASNPQIDPASYEAHMNCNRLFDGDGVFLTQQGDRMQRAGLTYRDYATPASTDILVNAFRRYLEAASAKTEDKTMVESANPSKHGYDASNMPRSVALDRYESHTKLCKVCSKALEDRQRKQKRLSVLQSGLTGAAGASTISLLLLFLLGSEMAVPLALLRCVVATTVVSDVSVVAIMRSQKKVDKQVNEFITEEPSSDLDY